MFAIGLGQSNQKLCKINCPKTSHTKNYAKSPIKQFFKISSHKNYQMRSKQISNKKSGLVVTGPVSGREMVSSGEPGTGEDRFDSGRTGWCSSGPACYRSCAAPSHTRDAAPCTV
jgi:hypothetical protein